MVSLSILVLARWCTSGTSNGSKFKVQPGHLSCEATLKVRGNDKLSEMQGL